MNRKQLVRLELGLRQLFARRPMGPADSLYIVPLRDEHVAEISIFGCNKVRTTLEEKPLKIVL